MSYIISYVGAGGKTSSIYQDAAAFAGEGKKVLITTTTHMYVPKDHIFVDGREVSCEKLQKETAGLLKKNGICVCGTILNENEKKHKTTEVWAVEKCAINDVAAGNQNKEPEKFKTLSAKQLTAVCKEADVVLIEADGAAHKAAKAPETWEPAVYEESDKVVIVMGLHAVGASVDEVCHRPERVKEVLDCDGAHLLMRTGLDVLMEVYEKKIRQQFPGMEMERRYYKKILDTTALPC